MAFDALNWPMECFSKDGFLGLLFLFVAVLRMLEDDGSKDFNLISKIEKLFRRILSTCASN